MRMPNKKETFIPWKTCSKCEVKRPESYFEIKGSVCERCRKKPGINLSETQPDPELTRRRRAIESAAELRELNKSWLDDED